MNAEQLRRKLSSIFKKKSKLLSVKEKAYIDWMACDGDNSYRLDYPMLTQDSIVFDLGGYKGDWAKNIYAKYSPHVFIFEPIPGYFENITMFFEKNLKIRSFNIGFGKEKSITNIYIDNDGSSILRNSEKNIPVQIVKLSEFILENKIERIDLMKINVEGAEFDIIDDLYESDMLWMIKQFQIQFHNFVDNPFVRLTEARKKLSVTHKQNWNFEFIWEGWSRIE